MSDTVITRFAPSPTGYLHIGGARTALFNWLYAKAKGGRMLLRIEDTDQARSTEGAILAILDGLNWLGLNWDGEPVYQLARAVRHREMAELLLAEGKAYRCYASPDELAAMRERARAEGLAPGYDGIWRDRDLSEAPPGITAVIRFKAPRQGETVIEDRVQGRVVFPNKDLDDLVLLRSDGTPTYNLSVVVDDHDMGITHVIRGDDHLTNAARQTQIYKALGWQTPVFAHVPLIHGADGAKLSKRHGALGVKAYRAMGYLPAALRNYLLRLGWSHGDDEIISMEDMIRWFDLDGIGRSAARFDFAKLENLNGHYLRALPDADLIDRLQALVPDLPNGGELAASIGAEGWRKLERALPGLKERAKTLVELIDNAGFLFAKRPLAIDAQAEKLLDEPG
ncbi:MAG: glutamate--tRNA ligase, partial [Methyloceanibacter sp.]